MSIRRGLSGRIHHRRRQRAQALVEFALVFPVFMLLLFGVIEVGRFVYINSALSQGAREGARVAAVEARWLGDNSANCVLSSSLITATNPGAHVCPDDPTALKAHVVEAVNRMTVALGNVSTVYLACSAKGDPAPAGAWDGSVAFADCGGLGTPNRTGDRVSVRIVYQYKPLLPLLGPITQSTAATMVIN